jgi:hypothetical protein
VNKRKLNRIAAKLERLEPPTPAEAKALLAIARAARAFIDFRNGDLGAYELDVIADLEAALDAEA